MPSRRRFLQTLAVPLGLAGCLAGRNGDGGDVDTDALTAESPGESETTSQGTPAVLAGECTETTKEWTDPARDDVSPKELPDGPPEMSAEAVRSFVVTYEERYLYNSILERNTESAGVSTGEVSVESTEHGFVVTLRSWYYHNVQAVSDGTETATRVHADSPHPWRAYLVTDSALVRATGEYDVKPDPTRDGTVLECWTD